MKKINSGKIISIAVLLGVLSLILILSAMAIGTSFTSSPQLSIVGTNLSFRDSIYLKYAVSYNNILQHEDVKLLIWTSPNESYLYGSEDTVLSSDGTTMIGDNECVVFDYKEVAAKEMTDYVYARAYYSSGGNEYYSEVKKYSVLTYIYNKLGYTGTATENENLAELLRGLLRYGASAQNYFDYKEDDLATDHHIKITLENGTFKDGSNTTLAIPGTALTVIAPTSSNYGEFIYWADADGNPLSFNHTFEIIAGASNTTVSAVYATYSGGDVDGVGATLSNESFALTEHSIDTTDIIDKTAAELEALLAEDLASGSVYRVSDGNPVNVPSSVKGNGATLIAPAGVIINNCTDISIEELIISGSVSIKASSGIIFNSVDIQGASTAISADASSSDILFNDCRFTSDATAISSSAFNTSVINSYIAADRAIVTDADEATVYNCIIIAKTTGVSSCGQDIAINNNDIKASVAADGIIIGSGSLNSLLSYNKIIGAENAIEISDATNTVILFNSGYNIVAENNTNTYIVENNLGGRLILTQNNYLLCDANKYSGDSDHDPSSSANTNVNGDNLMDVTARNDVGANEDLLPHTNKDLFLEMNRRTTVKDVANGTSYSLDAYIEENAKTSGIVIVPPGAYSTVAGDYMKLTADMSNTEIYAFGVYNEHGFNTNAEYLSGAGINYIVRIENAENITMHGITMGYDYQSSGQVHVLKKLEEVDDAGTVTNDNQILVVPAAGFDLDAGFGQSNLDVFDDAYTTKFKSGELYPSTGGSSYTYVSTNEDGTIVLQLANDKTYDAMDVGDIITCRMAGDNQHTVGISGTTNIKLKDVTLYGYSAALMIVVSGNATDTSIERVHNLARSPYIIDKETYDLYTAWETQYGVDLEIYQDELGRYRGAQARIGSVDATHVSGASEGLNIESCLFENMCDDGSNQRGSSSRLLDARDNGDGTTTIYYKGMVTSTYHGIYSSSDNKVRLLTPNSFAKGDRIYIYTSNGELFCDTTTLSASRDEDDLVEIYDLSPIRYLIYVKSVTVPTDDVNFDVLEGYDLNDNHYSMTNKVLVDNINHCSEGFVIDNLMVHNSTARGVLVKTINATVKNSTFRNVASTGNLLSVETSWGESTVSRNIVISDCLFDHTGFDTTSDIKAPIAISGLSTYGNANVDTLQVNNILITGCEFKDYGHDFGIYVNGAQDVRIIDNVFDPLDSAAPGSFIKILTAIDVKIEGNKYRDASGNLSAINGIDADDYAYIHGSDVGDTFSATCDVYIGNNHLSKVRIFPANGENLDVAKIMAERLGAYCGYAVSASRFFDENVIRLVVTDTESELIASDSYTITCDGTDLVITAATRASLIYAVDDFINYIKELNASAQTITFNAGYSLTRSLAFSKIAATDTATLKYSGLWNANGASMISAADADYVEFDFNGSAITLLFSATTECDISIDGNDYVTYAIDGEKTFYLTDGDHSIKILCEDTGKSISFAGIKYADATVSRTADREHYIQFIGDSMVDGENSFAHNLGDILGWDYSVVVGDTLPSTSDTGRIPDIVFIFLGTDAISSSSTDTEQTDFINTYKALVNNVMSKYGSSTKIYLMQALSTSDADAMFDTAHARYQSIQSVQDSFSNVSNITASTVQGWGIEFDISADTTYPTDAGNYTLLSKLAGYITTDLGTTDYINYTFPLELMKNYNGTWENAPYNIPIIGTQIFNPLNENGVEYNRYSFDKNGHVFISGTDYADIPTNSGRYLIIKYRTSGDYSLSLNVRTNDYGTDVAESGKGYVSSVTKPQIYAPTDWEIAVVDLAQFAHYTVGIDTKVQIRITTTLSTLDIAHVSIVDNLKEAHLLIMSELSSNEYTLYEDWSKIGDRKSLDGMEVVDKSDELIDFSYVNHNFNLITMQKYNGTLNYMLVDDDGTEYNRFEFSSRGHIFLKGNNKLVQISGDTGNYLVLKYRAQDNSDITLEVQTSHLSFNGSEPYDTLSTSKKSAENISTVWEVAVIDLSQFANYQTDSDLDILMRLTTTCEYVDIAYAAIVDDTVEASKYITAMSDSTYVHYTDWSATGTTVTID